MLLLTARVPLLALSLLSLIALLSGRFRSRFVQDDVDSFNRRLVPYQRLLQIRQRIDQQLVRSRSRDFQPRHDSLSGLNDVNLQRTNLCRIELNAEMTVAGCS